MCPHEHTSPDNWAYPEMLLNYISFSCDDDLTCNQTRLARQDFEPLVTDMLDFFKKLIFKGEILQDFHQSFTGYVSYTKQITEMINNKTFSMQQLSKLPYDHFAYTRSLYRLLEKYIPIQSDPVTTDPYCDDPKCIPVNNMVKLLHLSLDIGKFLPFGTFVARFADLGGRHSFSPNKYIEFGDDRLCQWNQEEEMLNEFFVHLGQHVGIPNISMYELPALLARPTREMLYINMTYRQAFLHTRCATKKTGPLLTHKSKCYRKWIGIISNESMALAGELIVKEIAFLSHTQLV